MTAVLNQHEADIYQFISSDDQLDAATPCQRNDPDLWFAEQQPQLLQAKALCQGCPLMDPCLQGALTRQEPWGVWGGEIFTDGQIVATKRGRGRPRKDVAA